MAVDVWLYGHAADCFKKNTAKIGLPGRLDGFLPRAHSILSAAIKRGMLMPNYMKVAPKSRGASPFSASKLQFGDIFHVRTNPYAYMHAYINVYIYVCINV